MRRLEVEFVNDSCALLRGYGSRDLVVELKSRPPVWATRDRAWVVQPATAHDVIALAESRNVEVFITGGPPQTRSSSEDHLADSDKCLDPGGALW